MVKFEKITEGKEIEVRGVKFNIKPLSGEHFGLLIEMENQKDKVKIMKKMIFHTLNDADETVTMLDVENLNLKELLVLFKEVSDINELGE